MATVNTYIAYRLNFILWRVRTMFSLLLLYFLWTQALLASPEIAGYTKPMIFTYIFLANFLNAVILSSRTDQIAGEIRNGDIINFILKPSSYFFRVGSREVVDKILNTLFSIAEIFLFTLIFKPEFVLPSDVLHIAVFLGFIVLATLISFYISTSLSLIAFWTSEIWAPRFIFMIFFSIVAGTLFPLDIYPEPLYNALLFTPFPYLVYVPAVVFIKGLTSETYYFAAGGVFWLITTWGLVTYMWRKGLREFAFFGR